MKNVHEVMAARETLEFEIDAFLRGKGWKHTSNTPGHYWMWEREIDGRRVLVEKAMALNIQAQLDDAERYPNGAPDSRRPGDDDT